MALECAVSPMCKWRSAANFGGSFKTHIPCRLPLCILSMVQALLSTRNIQFPKYGGGWFLLRLQLTTTRRIWTSRRESGSGLLHLRGISLYPLRVKYCGVLEWVWGSKKLIWDGRIPCKISILMWKMLNEYLPFPEMLSKFGFQLPSKCVFCPNVETLDHVFSDCSFATTVWDDFSRAFLLPVSSSIRILRRL